MSKAGSFIKKHPWEAAAIAAGTAAGGYYALPLLGGEAAAGAGALEGSPALLGAGAGGASLGADAAGAGIGSALYGASGLMDLAGATGGQMAGTPSMSSPFLSGTQTSAIGKGLKYAGAANKAMGLLNPQAMPPQPMGQAPTAGVQPVNTILPGLTPPAPQGIDPAEWAAFWKQKQQKQFGGIA